MNTVHANPFLPADQITIDGADASQFDVALMADGRACNRIVVGLEKPANDNWRNRTGAKFGARDFMLLANVLAP